MSISVAVHGLGNIGCGVIDSLLASKDCVCLGVVRRAQSLGTRPFALRGVDEYASLDALLAAKGKPDVAVICGPSRNAPDDAKHYMSKGINTVDSFDIHTEIPRVVADLDAVAHAAGKTCITAAGWDPGTDSVFRALFEAMTPVGTTFTNFGRGRSMGHSVAARAIDGVANACSITIPLGGGRHSRLVYVLPKANASFDDICKRIAADPYFASDPLDVRQVASEEELAAVADTSHGVLMERVGASGSTANQHLRFDMRIDNPALTAQILVSCARAATRLEPGCYTLVDVPPMALLPGDRMKNIARLV